MTLAMKRARHFAIAATVWVTLLTPYSIARGQAPTEASVKAAFVLRFVQYVDWPRETFQQPGSELVICAVGADAIAAELVQASSARTAPSRPIAIRSGKAAEALPECHVVFIGSEDKARLAQIVAAVRGRPILTVTETPQALEHGSMINFILEQRRVRFEISTEATEHAGLTVSSRLLAIAMRVRKGELFRLPMASLAE